jgi:hypothetical protein
MGKPGLTFLGLSVLPLNYICLPVISYENKNQKQNILYR